MQAENLESMLESLPTRSLGRDRERELLRAILDARSSAAWWRRGVPLWQTAAACLIAACLSAALVRGFVVRSVVEGEKLASHVATIAQPVAAPLHVHVDAPLLRSHAAHYRTDIRHWGSLASITPKGD